MHGSACVLTFVINSVGQSLETHASDTKRLCKKGMQAEWLTVTTAYVSYSSYTKNSMMPILHLCMSKTL